MLKIFFSTLLLSLSLMAFADETVKSSETATPGEAKTLSLESSFSSETTIAEKLGLQDFTIVNNSDDDLCRIHVSPSYSNSWEENVIAGRRVYSGSSIKITMNGYGNHCDFDVRVVGCSGGSVDTRLNLCRIGTYTVY